MRLTPIQQTLAITVVSVLFCSICGASSLSNPDATIALARALYDEGDWLHARIEAQRHPYTGTTNASLQNAIANLAALQINPTDTNATNAVQDWLTTHTNHTEHAWVSAEYKRATIPKKNQNTGFTAHIAHMIIGFYQRQIGPAIGQRCAMYPSCSHYSLEACRRYGLAGIPMTADRLIRESDHIRYRINPIQIKGQEKYHDPVKNHSHWFRRYNK